MKEEFKLFVKNKPELIEYVNNGKMTWQKFYEIWYLYGEDDAIWNKYIIKKDTDNKLNINSFINMIKNVNMDEVQKGVNSMQKAVELLQGLVTKDSPKTSTYTPRQLFKKFED